jgi:hypothetical protein
VRHRRLCKRVAQVLPKFQATAMLFRRQIATCACVVRRTLLLGTVNFHMSPPEMSRPALPAVRGLTRVKEGLVNRSRAPPSLVNTVSAPEGVAASGSASAAAAMVAAADSRSMATESTAAAHAAGFLMGL